MKTICFVANNLNNSGGTERVGTEIANQLASRGYKVIFTSIGGGDKPFFTLESSIKKFSIFDKPGRALYRTPLIINRLRKLFIRESVDVVIVIESMKVLFTLPATIGLPILHICWEHFNFKNVAHPGRRIARRLAGLYCDHIVTLTERDKQYWLEGVKHKSQIISIPNPSPFPPQYDRYINKNCEKTVIAVGHLLPVKGFDLLLEAWNEVSKQKKDWKLIIVGEGVERSKLETYIHEHGLQHSVSLPGKTNNIEEFYKKADVLCLTSRFEGLPMVLIEAVSYGIPVVSFDCETGPEEILSHTGSILVSQGDVKQLASSLISIMSNDSERNSISLRSLRKASEYDPYKIVEKWISLIEG